MSCETSFFLELPFEIRTQIYRHVFASSPPIRLIHITQLRSRSDLRSSSRPAHRLSRGTPYPSGEGKNKDNHYGWADIGPEHDVDTVLASRSWHETPELAYQDRRRPFMFDVVPWGKQFPESPTDVFLRRAQKFLNKSAYPASSRDDSRYICASGKYTLFALERPNIGLLAVSRQLHIETYPLFFGASTFVFDGGAINDLLFLSELPERYRSSLRKLVITAPNDSYSNRPWRMDSRPHNPDGPIPLFTAYAGFIASNLPVLAELAIEYVFPDSRDYVLKAYKEVMKLLYLGRIKSLKFIVTGCSKKAVLKLPRSSEGRYKELLYHFRQVPLQVAVQQYAFTWPPPLLESSQMMEAWDAEVRAWLKRKDRKTVRWRWADRDIDFSGRSEWQTYNDWYADMPIYADVQAVVEFFVEDRSGCKEPGHL